MVHYHMISSTLLDIIYYAILSNIIIYYPISLYIILYYPILSVTLDHLKLEQKERVTCIQQIQIMNLKGCLNIRMIHIGIHG